MTTQPAPLLVLLAGRSTRLNAVLARILAHIPCEQVRLGQARIPLLAGRRVLFALSVGEYGLDADISALILHLRRDTSAMEGASAVMLIDSEGEFYTKQLARMLAHAASNAGCTFPGKPLVEGTGSLSNLHVTAMRLGVTPEEAYPLLAHALVERLLAFEAPRFAHPRILLLHASMHATSNTLALGDAVRDSLRDCCEFREISLQNGAIHDCRGCSYKACAHFAQTNECFYGGSIVEDVFPALMEANALLLLCPNYNDSVSANIMAFINRLTALLVNNSLYDKYLYSIVVSGYSGSDLVAQQVLGALCLNKTLMLPPRFCLAETANDPGSAMRAPGVNARISVFAHGIRAQLLGSQAAAPSGA